MSEVEVIVYNEDGSKYIASGRLRGEPKWNINFHLISLEIGFAGQEVQVQKIPPRKPKRTWANSMGLRKP